MRPSRRKKSVLANHIKGSIIASLLKLMGLLPLKWVHRIGHFSGWLTWLIPNRSRQTTVTNINLCFPTQSEEWKRRMVKQSLIETGKTGLEAGIMWNRPGDEALRLLKTVHGEDRLVAAIESDRPLILLTLHLGCWEMTNLYFSKLSSFVALYLPAEYKQVDKMMRKAREQFKTLAYPADRKGVAQLYKTLKGGNNIIFLPDQEPSLKSGDFAPFYGVPALTGLLTSRLVQSCEPEVLFIYAKRLNNAQGFEVVIKAADADIYSPEMDTSLAGLNKSIENCINDVPEQYQWGYKRFKRRPEGMHKVY